MRRRTLLTSTLALAACPLRALAQERADWSATGGLEGREPVDATALTPEERRHVPVLVLPERVRVDRPFDLVVQVGVEPHTMTPAHHVDWIEVSLDDVRAFVGDLTSSVAFPVVRVPLVMRAPATLTVRAHCNLHGTWRTRRAIEVV